MYGVVGPIPMWHWLKRMLPAWTMTCKYMFEWVSGLLRLTCCDSYRRRHFSLNWSQQKFCLIYTFVYVWSLPTFQSISACDLWIDGFKLQARWIILLSHSVHFLHINEKIGLKFFHCFSTSFNYSFCFTHTDWF